jgi:TonB family protein
LTTLAPPVPSDLQIGTDFAGVFARSSECVSAGDAACAAQAVTELASLAANDTDRALVALQKAAIAGLENDAPGIVAAYNEASSLPGIDPAIRRVVAQRHAEALVQRGDFLAALQLLRQEFDCATWSADALLARAAAYLGINAIPDAADDLAGAIRLLELEGRAVSPALRERHASLLEQLTAMDENGVLPLARPAPIWPRRSGGGCGLVRLGFDITDRGDVENASVLASLNEDFDGAALEALRRWKYAPKIEGGLPVRRTGVETEIRFVMEPARCGG